MLYNNEDEFLKILADKISKLNTKQPSSNEWTDFELAYLKYKNKKQNKKWLLVLWFGLFSMFCVGLIYFITNQKVSPEKAIAYDSKKVTSENKATINNDLKKNLIGNTTNEAQNSNQNIVGDNIFSDKKNKSKRNEKLTNTLNENEPIKAILQIEELDIISSNNQVAKLNTSLVNLINSRKLKSLLFSNSISKITINPKFKSNSTDSIKIKALNTQTKSNLTTKYFELGLCIQNNNFTQLDYPSDQFFKGVGLNAGMRLQNNWSFNLGLNVMYLNQVKINKFTFQTEENQIERIDTTIKYNTSYNRLMMQFDTILSYKSVNHENSLVYKNDIVFLSLPFQIRYHIGNEKRSIYAAFGATGALVYQTQSNLKNVGLNNESNQSQVTYSFLFAPTIGIGFNQRIYKNWAFHLASNYSKYLNSNINQSNTFQLQTGLKYNF